MYFFLSLTIKSLERPRWCHSAVFIGSFDHVLRIAFCWLWRPHCICLEQNSIGKCPKDFEATGFHCCILNNTQLLNTSHGNEKSFMISGKVGTSGNKVVYALTSLWQRLCIPSLRTIAYVVDKQSGICRRYILLQGLCVSSVKNTIYAYNRVKIKMTIFFQI